MRHCLYIVIFFSFGPFLFGQALSKLGRFSVDFDRGCVPLEVNVTDLFTGGNATYFYGDGSPETTATTYTYTFNGTFQIIQVAGLNVTPITDTLTIEVFDPTATQFQVEKCNLNGITITSQEETYDFIRVYFTASDSATLQQGELASFSYASSGVQTFLTRGFYTGGRGNCTLFSHEIDPLPSLTTPSITESTVRETCRDVFALSLELANVDSLIRYQVVFEQGSEVTLFEGKINSNVLVIPDIPYDESQSVYCVRINAVDVCTGTQIQGQQSCQPITSFSATPFGNLYSTYTNDGVFINLDSVSSGSLLINRRLSSQPDFELRTTSQNALTDPISTLTRQYIYRIDYLDSCNEVLFSAETNPPLIDSDRIEENSYQIAYQDPNNFIEGTFQPFYEVGNATITTEPITALDFRLNLNPANGTRQFLQARVEYDDGIILSSNQIPYRFIPVIFVPKAFTPNGDQLNDTLELFGLPTERATTNIYTRWGQLIYSSSEPSPGWDGFINGDLAPEGTYLYEVIFEDSDGEKVIQKGTFALLKK